MLVNCMLNDSQLFKRQMIKYPPDVDAKHDSVCIVGVESVFGEGIVLRNQRFVYITA